MKKCWKWIVFSIFLLLFIILSVLVLTRRDFYLDNFVYGIISKFISDNLTDIIEWMTYIGSAAAVISITFFVLIFFKNKKYALYMSLNLIIITSFQLILKSVFSRNRPVDINLIKETGYSFPSGHSLTSMAFYGFIIYLIYISNLNKRSKSIFITLFIVLILVTGISRIYLGVHYFTDVIGGFSFSICYLIIYTSIIKNKLKSWKISTFFHY